MFSSPPPRAVAAAYQIMPTQRLLIVSDIHYASDAEKARRGFRLAGIANPAARLLLRAFHHFVWQRDPFAHNHWLEEFFARGGEPDVVIANGDYSCDSAFVGVSDPAARASAAECLGKLRARYGTRLRAVIGDHELGKRSLGGGLGGMRRASWNHALEDLNLEPAWRMELGAYVLIGVTSSLLALDVFAGDLLAEERAEWEELRAQHWRAVREIFSRLASRQRVLLFCHDPSALPFLGRDAAVRAKLGQIEQTIIGHLHTPLVFWISQLLAGMPRIDFCGHTVRRFSDALNQARHWREFRVRLCPALSGIQLLKDGGFYSVLVDDTGGAPAQFTRHRTGG